MREVIKAFGWSGSVSLRALTASAVLIIAARVMKKKLNFGKTRHLIAIGATTVAIQLTGLGIATPRIGTAMCAIFVGAMPLVSMMIGQLWGIEHLTRNGKFGVVTGLFGLVLLVGFPAVEVNSDFIIGCVAMICGITAAAIGSNYSHKYLSDIGSWEQTIGAFFFGGLMTLPTLFFAPLPATPRAIDYVLLITLAAGCSSLTYVLYFRLVAEVGATIAISVEFLVTLVAVIIGAGLLGEQLSALQFGGAITIIASCLLVLGLVPRKVRAS
jgi:drug/metabolite transporter (DMT)-like permease